MKKVSNSNNSEEYLNSFTKGPVTKWLPEAHRTEKPVIKRLPGWRSQTPLERLREAWMGGTSRFVHPFLQMLVTEEGRVFPPGLLLESGACGWKACPSLHLSIRQCCFPSPQERHEPHQRC